MKPRIEYRWLLLLVWAVVSAPVAARAEDWPLVRGDLLGTGVAHGGVPDSPQLLWKYSAGKDAGFDATAVIVDGMVYVGDNAGTFHAVHLADGTQAWKKEFPDGGFEAGAAVKDGRLYVGDINGAIYCLATADATEIWSQKLEGEVYAGPSPNGNDVLFTSEAGTLSCRNKQDGKERWPFHIEAPLRCTPTISGGRAALAGCDSHLHLIKVDDGKETAAIEIDAPTGSTPAMRDDRVYFGTEGGTFYAINIPSAADQKPSVAWTYHDPTRNQPIRAAAAVNEQIVVYGSQGKAVYGLDLKNGDKKWMLALKSRIESSPVIAGNRVIVATSAGKIYLLDTMTGDVKWEQDVGGGFTASPAVVDGKIILGNTDGTLYCFGSKQGNTSDITTKATKDTRKK